MSFAPIGQVLSHYSVVEQIGAGGMGVVYRAHDARLDRDVALKVLPPAALNDELARKRFRHEALALAKLNHPNIASIYDFDTDNGIDFLIMEFVDGTTLSTKLATAHLCEADVVTIGEQIAKGLGAAHEAGLVHCDLKPGNIILTAKQQVKLLDFGLARLFRTNEDAITESLSEQYAVAGTLPYMAPEQVRGRHADARTDLYALGAVLYEMATGQRPFPQRNAELVDAILNRPPAAPTTLNRLLTPGLEALILRALNKDPGDRYQTAQQLWTDLTLPHNSTTMGIAIRRNRAGWKRWALTGSLLLALLAAITQRTKINHLVSGKDSFPLQRQLAVLPFRNLDGNTDQAFVQGLADNISIKLS
jgi:serine/threonine protein kinase